MNSKKPLTPAEHLAEAERMLWTAHDRGPLDHQAAMWATHLANAHLNAARLIVDLRREEVAR